MGKRLLGVAVCALVLAFGTQASAQALRVGSVANVRFGQNWTLDGPQMANTRAKLLNAANFGVGGTVSRPITIIDTAAAVGSVNAALLAGVDVFFIGYLDDANANAFTGPELAAMQTWVSGGGTMIVTCDDSSYDAVCAFFGYPATAGSPGTNPIVPTAAGTAHPIFNGPFGVVSAMNEAGTQGAFTSTAGATILGQDSAGTPLPVVLFKQVGAGRVILMADVDLIANAASAGATITNQNDRFLGNLFAYVGGFAGPVGSTVVPTLTPAALVLLVLGIVTAFAIIRRRQDKVA
jgi:hypothetical protein